MVKIMSKPLGEIYLSIVIEIRSKQVLDEEDEEKAINNFI